MHCRSWSQTLLCLSAATVVCLAAGCDSGAALIGKTSDTGAGGAAQGEAEGAPNGAAQGETEGAPNGAAQGEAEDAPNGAAGLCPEGEPDEGTACDLAEPDPFRRPQCTYNRQCTDDECCPYDEYTCQAGQWVSSYVHCDGLPDEKPAPPAVPTSEVDAGDDSCVIVLDGAITDPCHAHCEDRDRECQGERTLEQCRAACDKEAANMAESNTAAGNTVGDCTRLRCEYFVCVARAGDPECNGANACITERAAYDGTCRPTR